MLIELLAVYGGYKLLMGDTKYYKSSGIPVICPQCKQKVFILDNPQKTKRYECHICGKSAIYKNK